MASNDYGKKFHESTRGRVVSLLRVKSQTVEDLARELGLTDNAVRTHLATLERDGIIRQEGVRRNVGAGKPAWIYGIAPEAEAGFSNAYVPVLLAVLEELAARNDEAAMNEMMRSVGRRIAQPLAAEADRATRMRAVMTLLNDLGAVADVVEDDGKIVIRGHGCVVGLAVSQHPAVCRAIETLLETIMGEPVHEKCERGGRPNCCFHVGANGGRVER